MGLEIARGNLTQSAPHHSSAASLSISEKGLRLGKTVLAKMRHDAVGTPRLAIDGAEERVLVLLTIAHGKTIKPEVLGNIRRASAYWSRGEKALAEIELALAGLPALKDEEAAARRLSLGEKLLAAGVTPHELVKACGLDPAALDLLRAGYDPAQPRVPAGNPAGGQWTSDENSTGFHPNGPVRSLLVSAKYTPVDGLPVDAKVVVPQDGIPIKGGDPPELLMAPPRADFREVYAAGEATGKLQFWDQYPQAHDAIAQEGRYDFQRDVQTLRLYHAYIPAANYAVGVYMAGAGYSLFETLLIAKIYAYGHSSNYNSQDREGWITRGWEDATEGRWK